MKVSEITEILDKWMPISIAEDFDNVGLIIGNPDSLVKNILVTLDTTSNVIDEAIDNNCNLIISYHPIIFNDLKKITSDSGYVQKSVIKAVKNKFQVAYIAMNKNGEVGSYSIEPGFSYMDYVNGENKEVITESVF